MLNLLIALLMSLGAIDAPADYQNATTEQQAEYQIIIDESETI